MPSILLIEDDAAIRMAAQEVLEAEGYSVLCASNGQEGLNHLRQQHHQPDLPDLILLDIMMPVMNGWEFRQEQKLLDRELSQIPVIVLSADNRIEKKAQDMGVSAYVKKPIDLDALLKTILHILRIK